MVDFCVAISNTCFSITAAYLTIHLQNKIMTAPPKKPLTAFLFFAQKEREVVAAEMLRTDKGGQLDVIKISKIIGENWRALSEPEREPYNAMAADDVARFDAEMVTYDLGSQFR